MRRDERVQLENAAIEGLGPRIDELINERFRRIAHVLDKLQDRTLIEPVAVEPPKPFDGQVEFADGVNWSPDATGDPGLYYYSDGAWHPLLDDKHVALTPPGYEDNPHPQYWHKILDPAWAHLFYQDFATPIALSVGQVIQNYTDRVLGDWQIVSDPVAGTIVVDDSGVYSETGTYQMSITGYAQGANNTSYVLTVYLDGNPTGVRIPCAVPGNATNVAISWSGVVHVSTTSTLDVRLESASPANDLSIYSINWSMHRINPIAGTVGVQSQASTSFLSPPAIPDDWGGPMNAP